jgi:hypothetical protein
VDIITELLDFGGNRCRVRRCVPAVLYANRSAAVVAKGTRSQRRLVYFENVGGLQLERPIFLDGLRPRAAAGWCMSQQPTAKESQNELPSPMLFAGKDWRPHRVVTFGCTTADRAVARPSRLLS